MPSPDQLAELQNPEILKAFLSDVKTSEIQSKLDAIKAQIPEMPRNEIADRMAGIAELRKLSSRR